MRGLMWTMVVPGLVLAACSSGSLDTADTALSLDTSDSAADSAHTGQDTDSRMAECATLPCGGDATGTWTLTQTCFDDTPTPAGECEGTTIRLSDFQLQATLTLNADGTFENKVTGGSFDTEIAVPPSCNPTASCPDIQAQLSEGYTCADSGVGGCLCTSSSPWTASDDTGAWSASGEDLTLGKVSAPYCTDSAELWVDLSGAGFIPLQTVYVQQ